MCCAGAFQCCIVADWLTIEGHNWMSCSPGHALCEMETLKG